MHEIDKGGEALEGNAAFDGRTCGIEAAFDGGSTYGKGVLKDECAREGFGTSPHLTGVSDRAKQFAPFAALTGFYEMIEEVVHGNIEP